MAFINTLIILLLYCQDKLNGTDKTYSQRTLPLVYGCCTILPLAYIIGLIYSLKTHHQLIYETFAAEVDASDPGKCIALFISCVIGRYNCNYYCCSFGMQKGYLMVTMMSTGAG